MQLTKYEHACFTLQKNGTSLVIDPGNFTSDFIVPDNVTGIVITHEHPDHFDQSQLDTIAATNPNVIVIAHKSITDQIVGLQTKAVDAGSSFTVGPFHLEFFGGNHAIIYPSLPRIANLGVFIDDLVYYPGDSFAVPSRPVPYLSLPISAPWMKLSEAIDFLLEVNPHFAFPTHDAILSDIGKSLSDRLITQFVGRDTVYRRLNGQTIEL